MLPGFPVSWSRGSSMKIMVMKYEDLQDNSSGPVKQGSEKLQVDEVCSRGTNEGRYNQD